MIAQKTKKDKSQQQKFNFSESFEEVRNLNYSAKEKMVQRQILAITEFVKESREKNSHFSWKNLPWPIQFLPVITNFFSEWGKISAVNPGLSGFSGLMGVSKLEINERLNQKFRPSNIFLKKMPKSREILEEKMAEKNIHYPIIIKPIIGERCTGVSFLNEENINIFLSKNKNLVNFLVEEFIDTKKEFALSWIRNPKNNRIKIISFTERDMAKVIGNGKTILRKLITEKCQELSMGEVQKNNIIAGFSKEKLSKKITGEKIISRTASIAYGTALHKIKFDDKQKIILQKLVTKMIDNFAGIYCGRFDLKANSVKELLAGKCFILEMNGVAGAPLDIYDEKIKIPEKYTILFDYFSRALSIADQNIDKKTGKPVSKITGFKKIFKLLFSKNKTQELPENIWSDLAKVIKISIKNRFQASDLGKLFKDFTN